MSKLTDFYAHKASLYGLTQEEREAIGYIDFHNNGEEADDDE